MLGPVGAPRRSEEGSEPLRVIAPGTITQQCAGAPERQPLTVAKRGSGRVACYLPAPRFAPATPPQVASARSSEVPRGNGDALTSSRQASCAALRLVSPFVLVADRQIASSRCRALAFRRASARTPRRHEVTVASLFGGLGAGPLDVEVVGRGDVVPVGVVALRSVGVVGVGLVDVVGVGPLGVDEVELVSAAGRAVAPSPR
jgi:hypothetical protein